MVSHLVVGYDDGGAIGGGAQHAGIQPEPIVIHLLGRSVEYSSTSPPLYDLGVLPRELSLVVEVSLVQDDQRLDSWLWGNGMCETFTHIMFHNTVNL